MNDSNGQSTKRFRKNMITLVVVGIVLVAAVYFGKKYKTSQKTAEVVEFYNQFSDETYTEFAENLEESIRTENPEIFNKSVDLASFFDFSKRELNQSYNKRKIIEVLKPLMNFGSTLSGQIAHKNDFKFTKFYKKDGVPHIIFRLYRPDFINFIDFTLGIKKDKIVITNMYNFFSGTLFSEIASKAYHKAVNLRQAEISNIRTYRQVQSHLQSGEYEEAYNLLISIPKTKRDSLHNQFLLIVASNLDNDKLTKVVADMKAQKPDDQRLHAYLDFQENMFQGDLTKLNTSIDHLKEYVGEDVIFDLFRGALLNLKSDYENAAPFFDRVLTKDPDFFDSYIFKLYNLLLQDKVDEALIFATRTKEHFSMSEEDLTLQIPDFPVFTNSEAYKNIFKDAE